MPADEQPDDDPPVTSTDVAKVPREAQRVERAADAAANEQAAAFVALHDSITATVHAQAAEHIAALQLTATAAPLLVNAADASLFIEVTSLIGEDGAPDYDTIDTAVADLVEHRPWLATTSQPGTPHPWGSGDGGPRGGPLEPRGLGELGMDDYRQVRGIGPL